MVSGQKFYNLDLAIAYVSADSGEASDRSFSCSSVVEINDDLTADGGTPYSFRAYDLTGDQARRLLEFYGQLVVA